MTDPTTTSQRRQLKFAYLAKDSWSPRFDEQFYTVCQILEGQHRYQSFDAPPPSSPVLPNNNNKSRTTFPAVYYAITVYQSQSKTIVWRRYSEFKALHGALATTNTLLPPPTCPWHRPDPAFWRQRSIDLGEYLRQVLEAHGSHPVVWEFLGLQTNTG